MQRPRDLPTHRGIAIGPRDAIFLRWDAPTFETAITERDHARLMALVRDMLDEEIAKERAA